MNEIVKYKNELNELNFYNLSAQDSNIFMVLCSKMRDKGTEKVTFTYQEIRELAKIKIHSNDDPYILHQYFDIALIFCISS